MTDYLAPTADLSTRWCPACDPARDPVAEILETRYCDQHPPAAPGADDGRSTAGTDYISAGQDAGGESNRAWCEFFHGARR